MAKLTAADRERAMNSCNAPDSEVNQGQLGFNQ